MLSAACVLMIATTSALQHHQAVVRAPLLRPAAAARHAAPEALLPKALAAVFLIPWGVQLSYAAEVCRLASRTVPSRASSSRARGDGRRTYVAS